MDQSFQSNHDFFDNSMSNLLGQSFMNQSQNHLFSQEISPNFDDIEEELKEELGKMSKKIDFEEKLMKTKDYVR